MFATVLRSCSQLDNAEMTASESNAPSVNPNIVDNAIVQKYYTHLYENTAGVYRFYLEESELGRPGAMWALEVLRQHISEGFGSKKN